MVLINIIILLFYKNTLGSSIYTDMQQSLFFSGCVLTGDVMLLQQTLFDAVVTAPMEAYWTALMLNSSG